ncbi:MAG: M14 family metallocarboxypeptidase [Nitrospinae bacterium]|nr:M14 family metallocarboxypeptidase [Nitrospinota bacterium]
MSIKSIRKYSEILSRLKSSFDGSENCVSLGEISDSSLSHSIERIVLGRGNGKRVLISAGIHGDEPAGVETVCSFIERKEYLRFVQEWEITLVPCINPFGYEANTRSNHEGVDLNRKFKSPSPPREVVLAQKLFDSKFDLTLELHEDVDSSGYYLFHLSADGLRPALVPGILKNVKTVMPINMDSEIDGNPANEGVIERVSIDDKMDWWPMAFYSLSKGTSTCLTLETATRFPMRTRVEAHLQAIETALEFFPATREEK